MSDGYDWARENPDLFERLTRAVRAADEAHEIAGGGSRHWIRECFIPALAEERLCIVEFRGGDPAEVLPADPRAGSQSGLNDPGGSPTSPPRRVVEAECSGCEQWTTHEVLRLTPGGMLMRCQSCGSEDDYSRPADG